MENESKSMSLQRTCSLAESLASLPEADRTAIIKSLNSAQAQEILYDWRGFWARPNQLTPTGAWVHWLLLAGRGFGKTRTGAETVREWAKDPLPGPIHLVAPTAGDIRKVMVEGPGGLLSCYPPEQAPIYEPSKGHMIRWSNGNIGYCFSADEPERLRGPQCLAGDTGVLMHDGSTKRIDAVVPGDYVLTRRGARRVVRAWMSSPSASVRRLLLLDGRYIIGTGDHRVCVMPASGGTEKSGTRGLEEATTKHGFCFTERSGNQNAAPFQTDSTFITLTEISTIIESRIWNSLAAAITIGCIAAKSWTHFRTRPYLQRVRLRQEIGRFESRLENFTALSAGPSTEAVLNDQPHTALLPALSASVQEPSRGPIEFANGAAPHIVLRSDVSDTVDGSAMLLHAPHAKQRLERLLALTAPPPSRRAVATEDFAQGNAPWPFTAAIVSVERLQKRLPVYDLEIEGQHEFFANGILVHNCLRYWCDEVCAWRFAQEAWDNLMFGFRLGDDLRGVITTTPKPSKVLQEIVRDPATVITRGTTYDNRPNLSPKFFQHIVRKYEGTRIGRQELLAEILEDVPGALWKMSMIDSSRITLAEVRWDMLVRIVVAVDPAVTSGEDSNETGIVVAGLTRSAHVIIIDDLSLRGTPHEWGVAAVNAYLSRRADRIVGEVNNGGDLVAGNIRAIHPNAPFRGVHASRGKLRRAEPVAALYEQGRVHHVGTLPILEQQMCNYVPGSDTGTGSDSPDRMDALVWAVTELLIDPEPQSVTMLLGGGYQISPV